MLSSTTLREHRGRQTLNVDLRSRKLENALFLGGFAFGCAIMVLLEQFLSSAIRNNKKSTETSGLGFGFQIFQVSEPGSPDFRDSVFWVAGAWSGVWE